MTPHTLAHALEPAATNCRHAMADILTCVICNTYLNPGRTAVDTCGARCYRRLLQLQRAAGGRIE